MSGLKCWLIWLNPVTVVRAELVHRDPNVYVFHRLFPEALAEALVANNSASEEFVVSVFV